jgi:hypothetical protein
MQCIVKAPAYGASKAANALGMSNPRSSSISYMTRQWKQHADIRHLFITSSRVSVRSAVLYPARSILLLRSSRVCNGWERCLRLRRVSRLLAPSRVPAGNMAIAGASLWTVHGGHGAFSKGMGLRDARTWFGALRWLIRGSKKVVLCGKDLVFCMC